MIPKGALKMKQGKNNKGFSLVELLAVVAIITVAVSIAGGAMFSVYRARSKRAAETLDAMVSQSKIDAMSGLDCVLAVELDDGDYYARLYRAPEDADDDADLDLDDMVVYKSEVLASDRLTITVGDSGNTVGDSAPFVLKFDSSAGRIVKAEYDGADVFGSGATTTLTLSSSGTHTILFYKNTGEHILDA